MNKYLETIPTLSDFWMAVDSDRHRAVPDDWVVFVTDIKTSTRAIEAGRYKEVNTIGASCIMALLNAVERAPIPYVFGGDGATFLVPPELADVAGQALAATRTMAESNFALELRLGRIPIKALREAGGEVKVARIKHSDHFSQTVFSGGGIEMAERWIKDSATAGPYLVPKSESTFVADFTGLECRWKPVSSEKGKFLSVVTHAYGSTAEIRGTYTKLIEALDQIYGKQTPVSMGRLILSGNLKDYSAEAKIRENGKGALARTRYQITTYFNTNLFSTLWKTVFRKAGDNYKAELIANSDFLKFDGALKFIVDSSAEQTSALEKFLDLQSVIGRLHFGIHQSESALVTCLVFERSQGNHVHFVDGSDGGYTQAAFQMKAKLRQAQASVG